MSHWGSKHRFGPSPASHLLALEPRMMFDAAAVATTQAVMADPSSDAAFQDAAPHHDPLLDAFAPDRHAALVPGADAGASREIVFIDTAVADYRQLAAEWSDRAEVVLIDASRDGVEQMRDALSGRGGLAAIHIVSHGEQGRLSLGTARLDAASITGMFATSLGEIGSALSFDGDILVYGCDFAGGAEGARAVESLAAVTSADVAASTDPTGAASRGGNWELETRSGAIEARTLAALDWAHTLDPNVAVPISVTANSLTVTFNGATVVTGTTGYGTDNRSPDVGVGAVARWAGAATLADGTSVDLKATVVSLTAGDAIRFNRPGIGANGDDPTFLLRDISTNSTTANDGGQVEVRWELVRSGTDQALAANVQYNILDIDGVGGRPNSRETVSTSTENLAYYTRARASNIFFTSSLDRITASGTQNENVDTAAPVSQQSAATFDWTAVSSFTLTYQLAANNGITNQAQFFHDGDADFIYSDPVFVSIPRLDLDGNDSTAAGNDALFTYREGDPILSVVDGDVVVINPVGPNSIIGGTVTLTNAKAGDVLVVGALPANITATTTTAGDGSITVTLTGAGSEADYATAFRAIGFRNNSDTPDPAQRIINVSFSNDTLTSAVATSRINVVPVNDAPVTQPDSATTPEDTPVTLDVRANDSDPDGDPLTVTGASALNGSVAINPDGTITYTPNPNYNGTDTITYTVSDGQGGTATGTVAVTITPVNDAPVPVGTLPPRTSIDGATVSYPTAGGFTDVDGDTLTYGAAGLPAGLAIDSATGIISGTLDRSASQPNGGSYTIVVTVTDPSGAATTQSFGLTVTNPVPTANDDTATTAEDTPVTIVVLANDTDPDGDPLIVTGAVADSGTVAVNADNSLTYTPAANFNGTDTIRYTISDSEGGTSAAIVTITVTPVNDAPRAAVPLNPQAGNDAAALSFPTAYGFTDPDGDTLVYAAAGLPPGLVIDVTTGVISGTLGRSASQVNGGNYTITITATDPSGASATQRFVLTVGNPAPIARPDTATTAEDTPVTIIVLANDEDRDGDPLTVIAASAANGTVTVNADNTLTYTPDANFNGTDTISYTIGDGEGGTAASIVTVTVTAVDDAPIATAPLPPQTSVDAATVSVPVAFGFTDPDSDVLSYAAIGLPPGLAIDPGTGVISGTLGRSASQPNGGIYTITVTATDPAGASATQSFTITVTNPPPVAQDDAATTAEDTPVIVAVLPNDSDLDGDPLVVIGATAANGSVTVNADNTLTYTPDANFNGTDTITYAISDGEGGTDSAIVTVTVTPVNDPPRPASALPPQTGTDAATLSIPTAAGFTDPDGDPLTYVATGLPPGLVIDPTTGIITGTLDRSASQTNGGIYTITVTAMDPSGASALQAITLSVTNPGPIAANDTATTPENVAVAISPLLNDSDPDGDPLTVTSATAANGTVAVRGDGTLLYTPRLGFRGTDTINYTISDGEGGTAAATVTVTVTGENGAPQPVGTLPPRTGVDAGTTSIPTAGGFADPDGDPLTYGATGLPPGLAIDSATGIIGGTLDRSASQVNGGVYTVTVVATDSFGATGSQSFTLTVTNPPPDAVNDAVTTAEDTAVTIAVLPNDSDPDGDPLTVTTASAPNGTVTINPDNSLTYTPAADFNGTDTITYTISDGEGGTATAIVTVTVTPVNDAPRVVAPLPPQTAVDAATITIPTASGFTDPDGDVLTFAAGGLPAGLVIDAATGQISGTLDRSASQLNGGVYTITVTATDPNGAAGTQNFTLTVTNPTPVAQDDVATTTEDTPVTIPVLVNDGDPDGDPLDVIAATAVSGSVVVNSDNSLTYTPAADFNGTDTITYTITDGEGGTATAIVTVTVTPVNDAPRVVAPLPPLTAVDAAAVSIPAASGFTDPDGDPLTYTASGLPAGLAIDAAAGTISGVLDRSASQPNGGIYTITVTVTDPAGASAAQSFTLTVTNPVPIAQDDAVATAEDTPVTIPVLSNDSDPDGDPLGVIAAAADNGNVIVNPDGSLTYTPAADFVGVDTIRYTISDGEGGTSAATVTVTVTPVNDAPRPAPITTDYRASDGETISLPLGGAFADPDGDPLTYAATGLPAGLSIDPATGLVSGTIGRSASQPNGGIYSVTLTATDPSGAATSRTIVITITNPAPIAANDDAATPENLPVTIAVLANDSDPDGDPLSVIVASAGSGSVVVNADGTLTYTPATGFVGVDTISYTISDGEGGTAAATVRVSVGNTPPVAQPIADQATNDGAAVTLAAGSAFSDANGDPLRFSATGLPPGLSIDPVNGIISGTLDRSASQTNGGIYETVVTADDGNGGAASTTIRWTIANPPPIAVDDSATTRAGDAVTIPVLANDGDPDGDPLTISAAMAGNGSVVVNADGTLTYTPTAGFRGTDTLTYTVSDGEGGTASATITVIVVANRAPVASDDTATTGPDAPVTIPVLANDSDPDGDPLTVTGATASNGSVVVNKGGTLTYTPATGFSGTDMIVYTVDDGRGGTASATVAVVVTAGNRAPVAVDVPPRSDPDGGGVSAPFGDAFSDPDGDPLRFEASGLPPGLSIDPDTGRVTGTIAPGSNRGGPAGDGRFPVTITARDPSGAATTVSFTWTVGNIAPIARNDTAATQGGTGVTIPVLANDSDADGDPLTVTAAAAMRGSVTINPDGTLRYTPDARFSGTDTIAYTVSDGRGGIATAVVSVTVAAAEGPPVFPTRDVPVNTTGGVPTVIDALAGVTDPDGDRLTITAATTAAGSVIVRQDGALLYTPPLGFAGLTTITVTVTDGRGGFVTGTIPVRVTDGRGADVEQLLRFGRPHLVDPTAAFASVRLTQGEVRNPLILIETVNGIRSLNGTQTGGRPVLDAVNAALTLRGTEIDPDTPILREVARLDHLADFRDAGDRLFDTRWGDFMVRGLTGFSVAADAQAGVMVESVVRDHVIYVEVRDIAGGNRAAITKVEIRPAMGMAAPEWLHVDRRGLAIIERGADMDELHLIVRVTRADGRVTSTPILVQGETGMVTLDRPADPNARIQPAARPLDATLSTPAAAAQAEAARLSQLFQ